MVFVSGSKSVVYGDTFLILLERKNLLCKQKGRPLITSSRPSYQKINLKTLIKQLF